MAGLALARAAALEVGLVGLREAAADASRSRSMTLPGAGDKAGATKGWPAGAGEAATGVTASDIRPLTANSAAADRAPTATRLSHLTRVFVALAGASSSWIRTSKAAGVVVRVAAALSELVVTRAELIAGG